MFPFRHTLFQVRLLSIIYGNTFNDLKNFIYMVKTCHHFQVTGRKIFDLIDHKTFYPLNDEFLEEKVQMELR